MCWEGDERESVEDENEETVDGYYQRKTVEMFRYFLREGDRMESYMVETELLGRRAWVRQRMKIFDLMKKRMKMQSKKDLGDVAKDKNKWIRKMLWFVRIMNTLWRKRDILSLSNILP